MADKIIGIAAITHDALADTPHKAYQIIAGEKAIRVIERLEVIKIKIENTPGIGACQFMFNGQFNLVSARQSNQGREAVLLDAPQLCTHPRQ